MAARLSVEVETALATLKDGLRDIYGPRLRKLILYGSQARGGAGPDSDIDVAVILDGPIHAGDEIARTSHLRQRINLDTEQLVSLLYLAPETLRDGTRLIYRNIRQDGVDCVSGRRRISWYHRYKESLMTVHLEWPSDVVDRLTEEARHAGLSLDAYVLRTILQQKGSNGSSASDETEKRRKREEAAARIRELRKGVTLGPDLTVRDLIHEGRRF